MSQLTMAYTLGGTLKKFLPTHIHSVIGHANLPLIRAKAKKGSFAACWD